MDQKKLMTRVKYKTDNENMIINSEMYFVGETVIFSARDAFQAKSSIIMSWLENEVLNSNVLYEPQALITISKVLAKSEKKAMLIMVSDGTVIVISSEDPKGRAAQVLKPQVKKD